MSDHIPDATKMVCPHCGLPEEVRDSGGGIWFECGSKHNKRRTAFCKEREPLWLELTALRTANAALVERVKRLEDVLNRILDNNGSRNKFRAIGLYDAQVDAERLLAGVES